MAEVQLQASSSSSSSRTRRSHDGVCAKLPCDPSPATNLSSVAYSTVFGAMLLSSVCARTTHKIVYSTMLYCSVLFGTVLHCNALHCTALHCLVLYSTVLCHSVLYLRRYSTVKGCLQYEATV